MEYVGIYTAIHAPLIVHSHLIFSVESHLMGYISVIAMSRNGVICISPITCIAIKMRVSLWSEHVMCVVLTEQYVMMWTWSEVESSPITNVING